MLIFDDSAGHWVQGPAAASSTRRRCRGGGRRQDRRRGRADRQPEQLVGQTEIFDGKAWHDGAGIPVPGDHLAAASDRDYLYAVGGRRFTAVNNTDAVQRYDPATNRWTTLAALPQPLSGAGVAIIGGKLLVVSGENATPTVSSTVLAYDLTDPTATWTTLPSLTQGRHGLAVAAIGNTLYAIDGSTQPGHTASTSTVGCADLLIGGAVPSLLAGFSGPRLTDRATSGGCYGQRTRRARRRGEDHRRYRLEGPSRS